MKPSAISLKCDQLLKAFEAKGCEVGDILQPGMMREDILECARSLPFTLPEELVQLYEWKNGLKNVSVPTVRDWFIFRDQIFVSFERALKEYERLQDTRRIYIQEGALGASIYDLMYCFPFAEFDGSWYAVVCNGPDAQSGLGHPVLSVHQGVHLYYHSLSAMLDTCVAWVSHPEWRGKHYDLPPDVELKIWRHFNDGVF